MSPFFPKIAAFWICVHVALWLLRRKPNSRAAKIAFSWQGPYPFEGEKKSSYYRRKALFAIGWLAQILTVGALVSLVIWAMPKSDGAETVALVAAFALSLGAGMAVLGAILAGLVAAKARLIGPDPEFRPQPIEESADAEESEA